MLFAYLNRPRVDPKAPWGHGILVIGPDAPDPKDRPGEMRRARLRLLPATEIAEVSIKAATQAARNAVPELEAKLRPKLVMLSPADAGIGPEWLESGRFPASDGAEVVAGFKHAAGGRINVGDRALEVVGVFKAGVALFADSYLIPPSEEARALLLPTESAVHDAILVRISAAQSGDRHVLEQFEKEFPSPKYAKVMPPDRLDPKTFYLYLVGQAVLLFAGSGALIGLYRWLAPRAPGPLLAAPLHEIRERPRLLWGVHLAYFGLVMMGSLFIYSVPEVQTVMVTLIQGQLASPSTPLGVAGQAYASGSIPRAAAVTFGINFFLGSLAVITLPSVVLPGSGILVAALRAFIWGVLLAPTYEASATGMLPHSWTMLMEGEGYIIAAFFGLLVPIHIFQSSLGGTPGSRFGRALLLNLKAIVLVALVLAVAAVYEAAEVITLAK
jgi:hypothetical protein